MADLNSGTGRLAGELIRKTIKGAGVATVVAGVSRLLFFVQQLVLANLLAEEDFGQFAFAMLVIGLPALLVNLRGAEAIVRSNEGDAEVSTLVNTAFTAQLVLALIMALVVASGSELVAQSLHKPYLAALLVPMSLLILTTSGGPSSNNGPMMLPAAVLERRLDFVRARLPELANVLVNAGVSIGLALSGFGVWSLTAGFIAGSLVQAALLWYLAAFRPRLRINRRALRDYLRFGWPLYLSFLLSWGYLNADYYFVGRWLGEAELGLYYMAFSISQVSLQMRFVLSRVALPAFSRARADAALLSQLYGKATRYAMVAAGGVSAIGIALAEPIAVLLLGERWLPAAPALRILLLSTWIRTGMGFNGELLISLGRTPAVLVATGAALAVVLGFGPPMMSRWGIEGMAVAVCFSSFLSAIVSSSIIRRHVRVNYLREIGPSAVCVALVTAAGLWWANGVGNLCQLSGVAAALLAAYSVLYLGLFDRPLARMALQRLAPANLRKEV